MLDQIVLKGRRELALVDAITEWDLHHPHPGDRTLTDVWLSHVNRIAPNEASLRRSAVVNLLCHNHPLAEVVYVCWYNGIWLYGGAGARYWVYSDFPVFSVTPGVAMRSGDWFHKNGLMGLSHWNFACRRDAWVSMAATYDLLDPEQKLMLLSERGRYHEIESE